MKLLCVRRQSLGWDELRAHHCLVGRAPTPSRDVVVSVTCQSEAWYPISITGSMFKSCYCLTHLCALFSRAPGGARTCLRSGSRQEIHEVESSSEVRSSNIVSVRHMCSIVSRRIK